MNACECLLKWACKRYKRTYESCECPTNIAIALPFSYELSEYLMTRLRYEKRRSEYDDAGRYSQGMGNGERYKRLANALRTLQMLLNALPTLPMACECLRKLTANDSILNIH